MLKLTIGKEEVFNDDTQQFEMVGGTTIQLEHSLVSLSKWEEFYEKPFLGPADKTTEQVLHYIQDMALDPDVPPELYSKITQQNLDEVNEYITAQKTATWFSDAPAVRGREIITAEVIYYWMIALNIPFETQHWHLNRLFTLIKVCNQKNQPPKKKLSRNELAQRNRDLNARRKEQMNTRG